MPAPIARTLVAAVALAVATACGGGDTNLADSTAPGGSATSTPPQPDGPMNMIDSATRAPLIADSLPPGAQPRGATTPAPAPRQP